MQSEVMNNTMTYSGLDVVHAETFLIYSMRMNAELYIKIKEWLKLDKLKMHVKIIPVYLNDDDLSFIKNL